MNTSCRRRFGPHSANSCRAWPNTGRMRAESWANIKQLANYGRFGPSLANILASFGQIHAHFGPNSFSSPPACVPRPHFAKLGQQWPSFGRIPCPEQGQPFGEVLGSVGAARDRLRSLFNRAAPVMPNVPLMCRSARVPLGHRAGTARAPFSVIVRRLCAACAPLKCRQRFALVPLMCCPCPAGVPAQDIAHTHTSEGVAVRNSSLSGAL